METLEIEIHIDKKIDVDIRLDEIVDAINDCEIKNRWNYIAQILNGVQLSLSDLTDEQKAVIKKYLNNKLLLF